MLKQVSNTRKVLLLSTPKLLRVQGFSQSAFRSSSSKLEDDPIIHSKIRDQIMAQALENSPIIPDSAKERLNFVLGRLKAAVSSQSLLDALYYYRKYKTASGLLQRNVALPNLTKAALGDLFVTHLRKEIHSLLWNDSTTDLAVSFALDEFSAVAIYGLMLHHLEQDDPQAVISLYNRYTVAIGKNHAPLDENFTFLAKEDSETNVDHVQGSILLAVTAAYSMSDSFKAAFENYMTSGIRISPYRKRLFDEHIKNKIELQQKVQKYIEKLEIACLVARQTSLTKHVTNLSKSNSSLLVKLYDNIIQGICGPDPYLAGNPSLLSDNHLAGMTEAGWTSFQTAFIKAERRDLAAHMWVDLPKCGIRPGVTMWTGLLDTHADLRDSKNAMLTWNSMLKQNIQPDDLSYRAIISVLFDDRKIPEAIDRFKEYEKSFPKKGDLAIAVYNTVLRGLLRINNIDQANIVLDKMAQEGPKPDIISYNTFLGYYSRQNDFSKLASVVTQMSDAGITGDVVTFSTILTALLRAGSKSAPVTILSLMRKQGLQPNVATYTSIVDHLMREQTLESLQAALGMLDKMEQDENLHPNEVTYTSILCGLYRGRWISRNQMDLVRNNIMERMKRLNVRFSLPTYHILIRASLDSEDAKGYQDALALIQDMENKGIPFVNNTWYLLLAGLMHRELWSVAREMVAKMVQTRHEPSARLQKLIDDIKLH